jgi:hypothetical protein
MQELDLAIAVVREWVEKAENDLNNAVHATRARYPGRGDISLSEARRSVAIARRIRKEIRRLVPRTALRRRKP